LGVNAFLEKRKGKKTEKKKKKKKKKKARSLFQKGEKKGGGFI